MRQVKAKRLRKIAAKEIAEIEKKNGPLQQSYKTYNSIVSINRIHRARRAYVRKQRLLNMMGQKKAVKRY